MRQLPFLNGIEPSRRQPAPAASPQAAGELNVSAAAMSRMVELLEERMGLPLFQRKANRLALTLAGRGYQSGPWRSSTRWHISPRK